jgi:hypothetical protein
VQESPLAKSVTTPNQLVGQARNHPLGTPTEEGGRLDQRGNYGNAHVSSKPERPTSMGEGDVVVSFGS